MIHYSRILIALSQGLQMKIDNVYDIDGTITKLGFDLWFLTTRELSENGKEFELLVDNWKKTTSADQIIESSREMMNTGVSLFDYDKKTVRETCFDLTLKLFFSENFIRLQAISIIKEQIANGESVHFSTANYIDAAHGFLDALVELKLISANEARAITVDGSVIDLINNKPVVTHINVAENKSNKITHAKRAYGDDPLGNDRGLASIADLFLLIDTPKNKSIDLYERLLWK